MFTLLSDINQSVAAPMNSIDRNQPERNHENLHGAEAIEKMKSIVDEAKSCFFCTAETFAQGGNARPMAVQDVDDDGNLWFLSADDSRKNDDLAADASVKLYFQGSAHSDFLELSGVANVSRDEGKIKELWKPIHKTWFTEGQDDPRITVIKVTPTDGYYWDTKHGNVVAGIKMLIGAATGKTLDDSISGKLEI
jgi:general stress protein 26